MRRLYLVLAVLVILLGLLHAISTLSLFAGFSTRAIWFAGSGLLLILAGALNLLNREYGRDARGLRLTTVGTNVVVTAFAALAGIASHASAVEFLVVVGLIGVTAVVSNLRAAVSA